jgi:tetratricopeptide (TPR) repeat protein
VQLTITYSVNYPEGHQGVNPADTTAKLERARGLHFAGELTQAKAIYEEILKTQPRHAEVLNLLGLVAAQDNNMPLAANLMDQAIACDPRNVEAYCNKGTLLKQLRKFDAALACYNQAIEIDGQSAAAHFNHGLISQELKLFDSALASYDRAIAINSDFTEAHYGRGSILQQLDQGNAALASFDRAIALDPDFSEAYSGRGLALMDLGQWDAALASLNQAIAIDPQLAEAHLQRSMVLLLLGDYERGWREYEWRWQVETKISPHEKRQFLEPLWLGGESIAGKKVLLYAEQGLGDEIQFCRYARLVADLGAQVILEVHEPLAPLLADLAGVWRLVTRGSALPAFDYRCPLLSLPLAFNTTVDNIPSPNKYLSSDASKVARWQAHLATSGDKAQPLVGLVWSGSAAHLKDRSRSIRFADLIQHLPRNYRYVSLQKEVREEDRAAFESSAQIMNVSSDLRDFSDTAALCECLDLLISVDTSVAHLSGSLGKRTWILLPFSPDWRWLIHHKDTSPWYSHVRLYRQKQVGDWQGVLRQVSSDLIHLFRHASDASRDLTSENGE